MNRKLLRGMLLDRASALWSRLPVPVRTFVRHRYPRPRFRAGVLCVLQDGQGRVLLLHHRFRGALPWGLPGGWLEPGEDPRVGMCRELSEELGLQVSPDALELLHATTRRARPHVEFYFGLRTEMERVPECAEFDGHGWFHPDELPRAMLDEHREILGRITR